MTDQFVNANKMVPITPPLTNETMNNCIIFNTPDIKEVIRLDKEGFHYNGQFIADAGEAHRLMVAFLKLHTAAQPIDD